MTKKEYWATKSVNSNKVVIREFDLGDPDKKGRFIFPYIADSVVTLRGCESRWIYGTRHEEDEVSIPSNPVTERQVAYIIATNCDYEDIPNDETL